MTVSRPARLRRVVILCRNFAVNLAYYRVGRRPEFAALLDYASSRGASFWRVTNANFIDFCVLEWCKLFADVRGKHHWSKVVSEPPRFKKELLDRPGLDEVAFAKEIDTMRRYRDKFLAHLDSDEIMNIPSLSVAKSAVWFYHSHIVQHEAQPGDLTGLPQELDAGYAQCEEDARRIYAANV